MKKIVICLNLNQKSFDKLKNLKDVISLDCAEITLVHVWSSRSYIYPGNMIVPFYPNSKQAELIEVEMKKKLESQLCHFENTVKKNLTTKVFLSSSPHRDIVQYLENEHSDLVVCLTPTKNEFKNFFHSSFTHYLNTHAPCDVLALRIF